MRAKGTQNRVKFCRFSRASSKSSPIDRLILRHLRCYFSRSPRLQYLTPRPARESPRRHILMKELVAVSRWSLYGTLIEGTTILAFCFSPALMRRAVAISASTLYSGRDRASAPRQKSGRLVYHGRRLSRELITTIYFSSSDESRFPQRKRAGRRRH